MSKWIEKTLGEVTSYLAKGIPPKYVDDLSEDTIYVLNQKCNRNYVISYEQARMHDLSKKKVGEEKMLRPGDVLINSTGVGTAGRIAQIWDIPYPTTTDGHMITMRPTIDVNPLFYGYAIKAYQKKIETLAEGSTGQTEINKTRLQNEISICFPENKEEQYNIAVFLENIDKKIEVNEKINRNLSEQLKVLFAEMFPGISSNGDSKLEDLIQFSNGKKRPDSEGDVPVYGGNGVLSYTDKSNAENCVIIGRVGAYCGSLYLSIGQCWISDNAIMAKDKNRNSQLFIYYLLQILALSNRHIGTSQPLLTQGILNAITIRIPEEELIIKFCDVADTIQKQIDKNTSENNKLTELRDSLLPKLMSGELDVSNLGS